MYATLLDAAEKRVVEEGLVADIRAAAQDMDVEYLSQEIPKAIQQSLDGVERVANIVRAMKEFSHPGSGEKTSIDLNHAIESTITVAKNEWKYVADVVSEFDPQLPPVSCLPGEFNQVILNILVNAAHAIAVVVGDAAGQKGTIRVMTRRDGAWAEVRISDTGPGIPEAIQNRVFDPFFTTKKVGKGTGQGLAIAHNVIVEKHGGSITFESEVGKGTTFIIRLPIEIVPE
jgi:signal transduction histidine kinase